MTRLLTVEEITEAEAAVARVFTDRGMHAEPAAEVAALVVRSSEDLAIYHNSPMSITVEELRRALADPDQDLLRDLFVSMAQRHAEILRGMQAAVAAQNELVRQMNERLAGLPRQLLQAIKDDRRRS